MLCLSLLLASASSSSNLSSIQLHEHSRHRNISSDTSSIPFKCTLELRQPFRGLLSTVFVTKKTSFIAPLLSNRLVSLTMINFRGDSYEVITIASFVFSLGARGWRKRVKCCKGAGRAGRNRSNGCN